jgi:hypothetical protein
LKALRLWGNKSPTPPVFTPQRGGVLNPEGNKIFAAVQKNQFINRWIGGYKIEGKNTVGYMDGINGNDFQHNNIVYIINSKELLPNPRGIWINENNILECSVYFFVRHCIEHTWINHNDQFLYPHDNFKADAEFQTGCLIYTLFHNKNAIQFQYGVNHWIPFTEEETGAKDTFQSNFMSGFLKSRELSPQAQALLDKGRMLWQYYHGKIRNDNTADVNASFYDIREFFQGRKENGTMNIKSDDETYNAAIKDLRETLKTLAAKIEPKVYTYGFLKQ